MGGSYTREYRKVQESREKKIFVSKEYVLKLFLVKYCLHILVNFIEMF